MFKNKRNNPVRQTSNGVRKLRIAAMVTGLILFKITSQKLTDCFRHTLLAVLIS